MPRIRTLTTLLLALFLVAVVPAIAVAQSAGEDQYSDPLQNDGSSGGDSGGGDSSGGGSSGGGGSNSGSGNSGSGGGGQAQPSTQTEATPAQSSGSAGSSDGSTLPHTGFPLLLVAGTGTVLFAGGKRLRRWTGPRRSA